MGGCAEPYLTEPMLARDVAITEPLVQEPLHNGICGGKALALFAVFATLGCTVLWSQDNQHHEAFMEPTSLAGKFIHPALVQQPILPGIVFRSTQPARRS